MTLLLALSIGDKARAQASAVGTIVVEQPWARATPRRATTGVAYMALINNGTAADRLTGATTPVADKVQFHQETEENGVSHMRQVQTVEIKPGAKVIFKPGEMHMMLVGLKQPLIEGQSLSLTLQFEKAGNIEATLPIEKVGAMQHENMGSMTHMPDDGAKKQQR
jgi:copper(I)-binding protein